MVLLEGIRHANRVMLIPDPGSASSEAATLAYRVAAQLSPDGEFWWDGSYWRRSDQFPPPLVKRSPDGRFWWDGMRWRAVFFQASAPTNGMAIASLVLGVLWIYWIGSILAIIFGHVSLRQIGARHEGGRGLAVAGLVLGYVGVGILAAVILAAISVNLGRNA